MILSEISLKNFRIHARLLLNFSEEINYIVGGNGQGKSTILESIYFLCTTKGYNLKKDSDAVKFYEKEFEIKGRFNDSSEHNLKVFYSLEDNKKHYFRDGKKIFRSSDIIGTFPIVVITPEDHFITQGSPGSRRKFVDSVISQSSEIYLKTLLDYNKTLRQRSSLLNQLKERKSKTLFDELEAWNGKLVETGSVLINYRKKFVNEFETYVKESYEKVMGEVEVPTIEYFFLEGYKEEETKNHFSKLLFKKRDEEIRRSTNLIGPHRDDFVFELNQTNLKNFGSQGQHKTFQIALKFAQFFYLKETTGKTPIFLLDDVFGELDAARSLKISEYLRQLGQTFITLTDFSNLSFLKTNEKDTVIRLSQGEAVYA